MQCVLLINARACLQDNNLVLADSNVVLLSTLRGPPACYWNGHVKGSILIGLAAIQAQGSCLDARDVSAV